MNTASRVADFRLLGKLFLLVWLFQLSPNALANSYLSELEAEANSTDVQAEPSGDPGWSHKKQGLEENLPKGLAQEEFEKTLKENYYGSYLFYEKLSEWNKKKVFETYQEGGTVEQVRNEIKNRMTK